MFFFFFFFFFYQIKKKKKINSNLPSYKDNNADWKSAFEHLANLEKLEVL